MSITLQRCLLIYAPLLIANIYMSANAGTLRLTSIGKDGAEKTTFNVGETIYWNLLHEGSPYLPVSGTDPNCTASDCRYRNTGWNFGDNCYYHAVYSFNPDLVTYKEYVTNWPELACGATGFTHWDSGRQSQNIGVSHTYKAPGRYTVYGDYVQTGVTFNKYEYPVPPNGWGAFVGYAAGVVLIIDPTAPPLTPSIIPVLPVIINLILN